MLRLRKAIDNDSVAVFARDLKAVYAQRPVE
jgi:hypothetical protein